MFHAHSSCISNMKNIKGQYITKESVSSKCRVDPESKKSNFNDALNWRRIVRDVTPSF